MAFSFTSQEKLALAMTSAVSMRSLAREMGITHQKLGRWLREGEPNGVKKIPDNVFIQAGINALFSEHKERVKEANKAFALPVSQKIPVYMDRKFLNKTTPDGEFILSDRVVARNTQYIRPDLRRDVIVSASKTDHYISATVQSTLDIIIYATRIVDEEIKAKKRSKRYRAEAIKSIAASIVHSKPSLMQEKELRQFFTRTEALAVSDPQKAASAIEKLLREKHESAIGAPGTVLAKAFVFQLSAKPLTPKKSVKVMKVEKPAKVVNVKSKKVSIAGKIKPR